MLGGDCTPVQPEGLNEREASESTRDYKHAPKIVVEFGRNFDAGPRESAHHRFGNNTGLMRPIPDLSLFFITIRLKSQWLGFALSPVAGR